MGSFNVCWSIFRMWLVIKRLNNNLGNWLTITTITIKIITLKKTTIT